MTLSYVLINMCSGDLVSYADSDSFKTRDSITLSKEPAHLLLSVTTMLADFFLVFYFT